MPGLRTILQEYSLGSLTDATGTLASPTMHASLHYFVPQASASESTSHQVANRESGILRRFLPKHYYGVSPRFEPLQLLTETYSGPLHLNTVHYQSPWSTTSSAKHQYGLDVIGETSSKLWDSEHLAGCRHCLESNIWKARGQERWSRVVPTSM